MKKTTCIIPACALVAIAAGYLFVGCEGDNGAPMEIAPSSVALSATNNTVLLTVNIETNSSLLPLTWSVRDYSLGTLTQNSGTSVVYQATAALGVNVVIARAVDGTAGTATITQSKPDSTGPLTVSPTQAILSGSDNVVVFTATITDSSNASSLLPLQWQESNSALGNITSASGLTATYTRNQGVSGINTIVVHAADGSQFTVQVTQQ
jgi:hypothetical protein